MYRVLLVLTCVAAIAFGILDVVYFDHMWETIPDIQTQLVSGVLIPNYDIGIILSLLMILVAVVCLIISLVVIIWDWIYSKRK